MKNSNFFVHFRKPFENPKLKSKITQALGKNSKTGQIKLLAWSWSLVWRIFCWPSFKTQGGDTF
jgi:hypothetical protein